MTLSEADTRAKLIDPVLHDRSWTEDLIRREETAPMIEIIEGRARRNPRGYNHRDDARAQFETLTSSGGPSELKGLGGFAVFFRLPKDSPRVGIGIS